MLDSSRYVGEANPRTMFVEGAFGSGKTSFAIETLFVWLESGIPAENILVLIPQRTLARRYMLALQDINRGASASVDIRTLGGLAKDTVNLYWPLIAEEASFNEPHRTPRFLTIETSQYAMSGFVEEAVYDGKFDAINVSPQQITRQIIDNLGKAAILDVDYREIPQMLTDAWGTERSTSRPLIYQFAGEVAHSYRQYCLEHRLLDYALQVELFNRLMKKPDFKEQFFGKRTHLIVEHLDEEPVLTHNLIREWLPSLDGALLTYEPDGGYRVFLGADPEHGYTLRNDCEGILTLNQSYITSPGLEDLQQEFAYSLRRPDSEPVEEGAELPFTFAFHDYYPQMLNWVADQVERLVHVEGVPPREIAILAPYLSDALRFSLGQKLDEREIPHISHRPSRALRDEPAARALLVFTALAHPHWFDGRENKLPPESDVANALQFAIEGLDPIRARLLAKIVYRPNKDDVLSSFEIIDGPLQARITYVAGQRYEVLRNWLVEYRKKQVAPLDHVFSRFFGEVLSQPGFGFHDRPESGRVVAELVESAQKFRQTLYTDANPNLDEVGRRYYQIVEQGLLAALYVSSWRDELADAVFMAPAYTFLMRNRAVKVQFWLDIGAMGWWERIDQPLSHPYVLSHSWEGDRTWEDADEFARQQDMLYRIMSGLIRRTREKIYLGISDLGEQGYEQRGPMLRIFQQILRRHPHTPETLEAESDD